MSFLQCVMAPNTDRTIRSLQYQTADVLASLGEQHLANAVYFCHRHNLCNQRAVCPRCAFERANQRWKAIKRTILSLSHDSSLTFLAFTESPGDRIPLPDLRRNARRFMRNLLLRTERIPGAVGTLLVLEAIPAMSSTGAREVGWENVHAHGLIAFDGQSVHFDPSRFDHSEIIPTAGDALGWGNYTVKAGSRVFAQQHWRKLLAVPESFLQRARQLRALRPVRSSGRLKVVLSGSPNHQPHTVRPIADEEAA